MVIQDMILQDGSRIAVNTAVNTLKATEKDFTNESFLIMYKKISYRNINQLAGRSN